MSTRRVDRYEVLETLDSRPLLAEYLARDPETGKTVVVDTLAAELFPTRRRAEEWLTQARSLRRFRHPNLVPVLDFGRLGCFYIVRDWVAGLNLAELQAGEWKFDAVQTAQIGASVAEALSYLHRNNRLHGAVCPRNVILGTEGEIRLTGLGNVLLPVPGELEFVAPELQQGEKPQRAADMYSLGALMSALYRVGGTWKSESAGAAATSPMRDPLAALISTLMADDPQKRPQSAGAIAETLNAMVRQALPAEAECEDEVLELSELPADWSVPIVMNVTSSHSRSERPADPGNDLPESERQVRKWRFWRGAVFGAVLLCLAPTWASGIRRASFAGPTAPRIRTGSRIHQLVSARTRPSVSYRATEYGIRR